MGKNKIEKALDEKFKGLEAKAKKSANELVAYKEQSEAKVVKLKKALKKQGEQLSEFMNRSQKGSSKSFDAQFDEFLIKNQPELKKIFKSGQGLVTFKMAGGLGPADITTASESVVAAPHLNNDTRLNHFNLENYNFLLRLVSRFNTSQASYPYTELIPGDGDFAVVAEGAKKPQIDFEWKVRYAEVQKSAAYEVLTEEVVKDVKRMRSIAREYLKKKHDIHKAKQIINYCISIARTFNAGAMANQVDTPVFMDVVNSIATDIATTHAYEDEKTFMPSLVAINPVDFFINFASAKDTQGKPLYPSATLFNKVSVGGMLIIPSRLILSGKVLVCDMSNIHLTNYVPYHVRIGWINDNFIHNKFIMLGESRYHLFAKEQDKMSFVHDDYATVKAAIALP